MKALKSIDAVRGIAIIMIILVHFHQSFPSISASLDFLRFGQMGCQLFFVISGFCIAGSFRKKLSKSSRHSKAVLSFYTGRFHSIAPAYYTMMAIILVINTILLQISEKTLSFGTNRSLTGILCNVLFINGLVPPHNNNVMPGGWYIGTTMVLYFLLPFVYQIFEKFPHRKKTVCCTLSAVSLLILVCISLFFPRHRDILLTNNSFGYFSFLNQFPSFCLGILLYLEYAGRDYHFPCKPSDLVLGILFMLSTVFLFFNFDTAKYIFIALPTLMALAAYYLLRYSISKESDSSFNRLPSLLFQKLGRKSYYIYLTHCFFAWTMPQFTRIILKHLNLYIPSILQFTILLPCSILFSYIAAVVLEKFVKLINKCLYVRKT